MRYQNTPCKRAEAAFEVCKISEMRWYYMRSTLENRNPLAPSCLTDATRLPEFSSFSSSLSSSYRHSPLMFTPFPIIVHEYTVILFRATAAPLPPLYGSEQPDAEIFDRLTFPWALEWKSEQAQWLGLTTRFLVVLYHRAPPPSRRRVLAFSPISEMIERWKGKEKRGGGVKNAQSIILAFDVNASDVSPSSEKKSLFFSSTW